MSKALEARAREQKRARDWFNSLSRSEKFNLGDELVFGSVDWLDWGFEKKPSAVFVNEVDKERLFWESEEDN